MKKLYRFDWESGYGEVEGLFVSTDEELAQHWGKLVSFGDCLGKHSDVCGHLAEEDVKVVSVNQEFITLFENTIGKSFGKNPLRNLREE